MASIRLDISIFLNDAYCIYKNELNDAYTKFFSLFKLMSDDILRLPVISTANMSSIVNSLYSSSSLLRDYRNKSLNLDIY